MMNRGTPVPICSIRDQRYFAYASVAISDAEAFDIIQKARTAHPVQMPELKSRPLLSSDRGRRLVASLLSAIEGRYTVSINDKLLALFGWFFEWPMRAQRSSRGLISTAWVV